MTKQKNRGERPENGVPSPFNSTDIMAPNGPERAWNPVLRRLAVVMAALAILPSGLAQEPEPEAAAAAEPAVKPIAIADIQREEPVDFAKDIYPLFKQNCIACHNATKAKAKLNLESPAAILKGSSSGEVVVPGKPLESLLLIAAAHMDEELVMPPDGNKSNAVDLTPEQLGLLKLWIAQGAKGEAPLATLALPVWQKLADSVQSIFATAVSPDNRFVACGRGNHIFIYDLATGELNAELIDPALADTTGGAHNDVVQSLEFSPRGVLASGGFRSVKIWELQKIVERFDAGEMAKVEPAIANRLQIENNTVKLMKPDISAPERAIDHGAKVVAAVADAAALRVASLGEDGKIKLWEFTTGKALGELKTDAVPARSLSEAQRSLNAAQAILKVRKSQFDAAEKKVTEELDKSKKAAEAATAADADFKVKQSAFVTADEAQAKADREVVAKEAAKHPQLNQAKEAAKSLAEEAKKKAGELDTAKRALVNATRNRELALRFSKRAGEARAAAVDALAGAEAIAKAEEAAHAEAKKVADAALAAVVKFKALAFSPDGKLLVAGAEDGRLFAWAARDGAQIGDIGNNAAAITQVQFLAEGGLVAAGDGKTQRVWESRPAWKLARSIGDGKDAAIFSGRVSGLGFSPDGETLATGSGVPSRSGDLKLFSMRDGTLQSEVKDAHSDTIVDVAVSPDGKSVATAGMDRVARVFSVEDPKVVGTFEGHGGHVLGVSWRDDGRVLATAGADKKAKLWDVEEAKLIKNIEGFTNEVTAVEFVGLGEELLTSSGDKNVRIGTAQLVDPEKCFLYSVAASPDGQIVAAGGDDGTLRVWNGKDKTSLFRFAP